MSQPSVQPFDAFPVGHELHLPPANFLETDLRPWHERMQSLMSQGAAIIAFRGAGGATGIESSAVEPMVNLIENYIITKLTANGRQAVLISDGDDDIRQYPDVGAAFGMLADRFAANPAVTVIPMAVQTTNWYERRNQTHL